MTTFAFLLGAVLFAFLSRGCLVKLNNEKTTAGAQVFYLVAIGCTLSMFSLCLIMAMTFVILS